jgi:hypothetical protein
MSKIRLEELFICITYIIMINLFFTMILLTWVTDDDLNNIPEAWGERFVSIFYYLITTFTTTGYGDIYAKSVRMKLFISAYMIIVFSLTVSFLFDFKIKDLFSPKVYLVRRSI